MVSYLLTVGVDIQVLDSTGRVGRTLLTFATS